MAGVLTAVPFQAAGDFLSAFFDILPVLVVIVLIAGGAVIATAAGQPWGPLLLGLGFLAWGALCLLGGTRGLLPLIGGAYIGGGMVELAAASEYWARRAPGLRLSIGWRMTATLVGTAGTAVFAVLIYAILVFIAWMSSL